LSLLSWLLLSEKLNHREWLAIIVGFIGILFIFRPDLSMSFRDNLLGIGTAVLTAISYLSVRQLGKYYDSRSIILSFMLSGIVMPIISMSVGAYYPNPHLDFLIGTFTWPTEAAQWFGFLALGITALLGQKLLTQAFMHDKAGRVAVVGYSNILFSVFIGMIMGEAIPNFYMTIGIAMIICGGILVSVVKKKSTV
jgi:drug/metabolite transporter (DMT)-like permease